MRHVCSQLTSVKRILITGAAGAAGVNFIRSLRSAPEQLFLVGTDANPYHLVWIQDNAHPEHRVDEARCIPKCNDPSYLSHLNALIRETDTQCVYAQTDAEVRFFSEHRSELAARTLLPKHETILTCQDKFLSAHAWHRAGLPVSKTLYVTSKREDLLLAEGQLGYPYWIRASRGASSRGSSLVERMETAEAWLRYWESRNVDWKFIAQEYLPGEVIAFQSLWNKGKIVTSQARERIEYLYPDLAPSGVTNTPVVARTIHRSDVNEMATQAVLSIDPDATGVFCVDLRENAQGVPTPTEINTGRFFTTSYFFTAGGVNMPYLYIKLAFNEPLPALPPYDAVPADWYWCRHIDCPGVLVKNL